MKDNAVFSKIGNNKKLGTFTLFWKQVTLYFNWSTEFLGYFKTVSRSWDLLPAITHVVGSRASGEFEISDFQANEVNDAWPEIKLMEFIRFSFRLSTLTVDDWNIEISTYFHGWNYCLIMLRQPITCFFWFPKNFSLWRLYMSTHLEKNQIEFRHLRYTH